MIRIGLIICAVVVVLLGIFSLRAGDGNVFVDVSCDDFVEQGGAISEEVEVDQWVDLLIVNLCSNQTTGFEWELTENTNEKVLIFEDTEYVAPEAEGVVGAAGKEVWTFKPFRPGETTISMEYSQPWSGGEKAVRTFLLTVSVDQ